MSARRLWFVVVAVLGAMPVLQGAVGLQQTTLARVSGVVLTTEDTPRAVRRAIVSLRGSDLALGHHAITDDQGRFEFRDLPAGKYSLSAQRPAFVSIEYGASRPGYAGTPIALAAGQRLSGVTVRMALGAVITGTVRDHTGSPEPDLTVYVERLTANRGMFFTGVTGQTDPQGVFRIYGLAPGPYIVSLIPPKAVEEVVFARSDADVDAIFQQLQQGRPAAPQASSTRSPVASPPMSDFTSIFYPDAVTFDDATPIVLAAGEERTRVDLTIRLMSKVRVVGRVVAADGQPLGSAGLRLVSRHQTVGTGATTGADGTFEISGVAPGRYQLVTLRPAAAGRPCEFAAAYLEIRGNSLPDVMLALKPCLKIAARVETASDATPGATRASLTGALVRIEPDLSSSDPMYSLSAMAQSIGADGTLSVGGTNPLDQLVPGAYLIHADAPGSAPGKGWWLESARTADGLDILDVPLTLTDSSPETTNVVLTFTDRHTSLSGSLVTAGGRPAIDYTVIVFTSNRDWWRQPFRRVLTYATCD